MRAGWPVAVSGAGVLACLAAAAFAQAPSPKSQAEKEHAYLTKLGDLIDKHFVERAVGYAIVATLPSGANVATADGDARRAPDASPRKMSVDEELPVASINKTVTATAIMQLLAKNKLNVDAPVAPWLPPGWTLGDGRKEITFRGLLSHRAGNRCRAWFYQDIRKCFATALKDADKGAALYINSNFAVLAFAIPRLDGIADKALREADARERSGDKDAMPNLLGAHYLRYVNAQVFKPLGFPQRFCKAVGSAPALAYKSANPKEPLDFAKVLPGEAFADRSSSCGAGGWWLSARQLALFVHALVHTGKLVPRETAAQMKADNLGLFTDDFGEGLTGFSHAGVYSAAFYKGEINAAIVAFDNGVTAGLLVNSKFRGKPMIHYELADAVREAGEVPKGNR
jgi:CubicO group peptidase (beta-lactamase class C family)